DTKDLDKVNDQAFNYKNNQPDCVYVITSNFEKLRFFIHNAVEHIEFNLFTLSEDKFALLWLFLQKDNLLGGIPAKVKEESLLQEDKITKALYADYSAFKNDLWNNMVEGNPQHDPLLLYKKSQKLLDRFLFIFFSEDKGLLPPNSISSIVDQWADLKDRDTYSPLYSRFQKYFGYMNDGFKGKFFEIHAYNGGLFLADELLDGLLIDDELLKKHCLKLTKYDFADEVDTNILGHIFEHSLNDIENVRAQLAGEEVDKSKTKRKKDGVFYTPKYITKYIVDNTVGKLCEEKKAKLEIDDEEFAKDRKGRKKATILKLDAQLKQYREWLLQLTICDPACGSGAFLNQALEFLMAEHRYVDELEAQLFEGSIVFQDVENHILENNIYGVDINEESVEIARLSLWLRTAQKGRKLTSLSSNIKCGNSLIDDPEVAGDLAFNWEKEFPQVFNPSLRGTKQSGFDVVIGNPPYVFGGNSGITDDSKDFFKSYYETGSGKVNLFTLFIERSHTILKQKGEFSFIIPNTFLRVTSYHESRKFFIDKFNFRILADLGADIFEGAVTTAIILIATKELPEKDSKLTVVKDLFAGKPVIINLQDVRINQYVIASNLSPVKSSLLNKMVKVGSLLGEECEEMIFGVVITKNKDEVVSEVQLPGYKPFLEGRDISSYVIKKVHQYLNYEPSILHRARTREVFEVPEKLLVQRITGGKTPLKVAYDNNGYYNKESLNNIILKKTSKLECKFLLALLNSSLINWYYSNQFTNESTLTVNISKEYLSRIPVIIPSNQSGLVSLSDDMIKTKTEFTAIELSLLELLQSKFDLPKPSKKLQDWPSLDFKGFLAELKKAKVPALGLEEEAEWMNYFNKKKAEANALQSEIDRIDKQIDQMVYELYGLSEEEIAIVEST
ncbi:MAG TPA: restriction endonuclease subunit M, partial [Flavobacteriales bacterium]|nr:restriction endonuclease subunit M [Flavobacteriales bacterium]